jgi:hypothetical protein
LLLQLLVLQKAKKKWIPFAFLAFAMAKGAKGAKATVDTRLEQVFEPYRDSALTIKPINSNSAFIEIIKTQTKSPNEVRLN